MSWSITACYSTSCMWRMSVRRAVATSKRSAPKLFARKNTEVIPLLPPEEPLKDDFPRTLTRFEKSKIASQLQQVLQRYSQVPVESVLNSTPPTLASNNFPSCQKTDLILTCLPNWPLEVALKNLHALLSDNHQAASDPRTIAFLSGIFRTQAWRDEIASQPLVQLFILIAKYGESLANREFILRAIAHELVVSRELHELEVGDVKTIVDGIVCELVQCVEKDKSTADLVLISKLTSYADDMLDVDLCFSLAPIAVSRGTLPLPDILIPILPKSKMISLLETLRDCDYPDVIARTVRVVGHELGRVAFHRLVSSEEKDRLLDILFRLKMKLDSTVHVEENPFYQKGKCNFFKKQILRSLGTTFEQNALALPFASVPKKMIALLGINSLSLKSLELVANRIAAFGASGTTPLLLQLTPTDFTYMVHSLSNHHQSWRKKDTWRQFIATPMARALAMHAPMLTPTQKINCANALMLYHNKHVRRAIYTCFDSLDCELLQLSEKVNAVSVLSKLKLGDGSVIVKYLRSMHLAGLNLHELTELMISLGRAHIVATTGEIMQEIQTKVKEGHHLSPVKVSKLLKSFGVLGLHVDGTLIPDLVETCLPDPSGMSVSLNAAILSALGVCSQLNPGILTSCNNFIETALLTIAQPEHREQLRPENLQQISFLGDKGKLLVDSIVERASPVPLILPPALDNS